MKFWQSMAAVGLLSMGSIAQAGLIPSNADGVDLVYDDDYGLEGLTWTADANLSATEACGVSGISADGQMEWNPAQMWIDGMNAANYGGANNWRLFSALNSDGTGPCSGLSCTDSEMGHLFYVEGLVPPNQGIATSPILTALFDNMQNSIYHSDTEDAGFPNFVWNFNNGFGLQSDLHNKFQEAYVWAVRPGRVAAAPLPGTTLLITLGLLGLGAGRGHRVAAGHSAE